MKTKLTKALVYGFLAGVAILILILVASSKSYFLDSNVIYGKF